MISKTEETLREVAMARAKQQTKHGHINDHGVHYDAGQMAMCAAYMAYPADSIKDGDEDDEGDFIGFEATVGILFPKDWNIDRHAYRNQPYRDRLIEAAALLVAEVERIDG
jgi:hypothetical protein